MTDQCQCSCGCEQPAPCYDCAEFDYQLEVDYALTIHAQPGHPSYPRARAIARLLNVARKVDPAWFDRCATYGGPSILYGVPDEDGTPAMGDALRALVNVIAELRAAEAETAPSI